MSVTASCIIPYYMRSNTIERAVLSAKDIDEIDEIVIVDDEASLASETVLSDIAKRYEKTKVCTNYNRQGALSARITGSHFCKNEYIVYLDSDDELITRGVKKCLSKLKSDSSLALCYGNINIGNESQASNFLQLEGFCFHQVLRNMSLCPFTGLCIKKSLIRWETLKERIPAWQDDEFMLTVSKYNKIMFVNCITGMMHNDGVDRISDNKLKQLDGLNMLLSKWKADILLYHGLVGYFMWKLRVISLTIECWSQLNARRNSTLASKIYWKLSSISIRFLQVILKKVFSVYFDRIYV